MARLADSIPPKGDMYPVIAILEDTPFRIEWFERHFPYSHVAWSTTVSDFCASVDALALSGRLQMIILDHDLGCNPLDMAMGRQSANAFLDRNGEDGMDACRDMGLHNSVPILIWSGNSEKVPLMVKTLKDRGFYHVGTCPVDIYPDKVKDFVKNVIG